MKTFADDESYNLGHGHAHNKYDVDRTGAVVVVRLEHCESFSCIYSGSTTLTSSQMLPTSRSSRRSVATGENLALVNSLCSAQVRQSLVVPYFRLLTSSGPRSKGRFRGNGSIYTRYNYKDTVSTSSQGSDTFSAIDSHAICFPAVGRDTQSFVIPGSWETIMHAKMANI